MSSFQDRIRYLDSTSTSPVWEEKIFYKSNKNRVSLLRSARRRLHIGNNQYVPPRRHCNRNSVCKHGRCLDGKMRLRIVTCVRFDRYVYEDVAQWTIEILEFMEEEYVRCMMSGIPVFIANGLVGVLSCHNDLVPSELVIPAMIENHPVCGVIQCGFYGCKNLTKVVFSPKGAIVYPIAFSYSGLKEMVFNNEIPVFLHISSIDGRTYGPILLHAGIHAALVGCCLLVYGTPWQSAMAVV